MIQPVNNCPTDHDLWPAFVGEALSPACQKHVEQCSWCQKRIERRVDGMGVLRGTARALDAPRPAASVTSLSSVLMWAATDRGANQDEVTPPTVGPGQPLPQFGKYRVIRQLSSGGQATVYHAWHTILHREVALKIAHASLAPLEQSRLLNEGALLARVSHPALGAVYDVELYEDRPCLVMEYVAGLNLRQLLQMTPLPLAERLRIMRDVAAAVAAAHRDGILHLDLKPENVMLDQQRRVKLIDLGMGWLLPRKQSVDRRIMGTLAYMAPEQWLGRTDAWGSHTDVFGLGALLYFLLTGRPPLDREQRLRTEEELETALQESIRQLQHVEGIGQLAQVCSRALQPNPVARFRDVEEFAQALRRCQSTVKYYRGLAFSLLAVCFCAGFGIGWEWTKDRQEPLETIPRFRVQLSAQSDASQGLSLWIMSQRGGIIEMEGVSQKREGDRSIYELPEERPLLVSGNDWVLLLAVEAPEDRPLQSAVIRQILQQISGAELPSLNRVDFNLPPGGKLHCQPTLPTGGLLGLLGDHLRAQGLTAAGTFLRQPDSDPDRPVLLQTVRLAVRPNDD